MTRWQALLLIAIVLAGFAFRQNVRWPEHLWDAPAFRTFRIEDLPKVVERLAQPPSEAKPADAPPTPAKGKDGAR